MLQQSTVTILPIYVENLPPSTSEVYVLFRGKSCNQLLELSMCSHKFFCNID